MANQYYLHITYNPGCGVSMFHTVDEFKSYIRKMGREWWEHIPDEIPDAWVYENHAFVNVNHLFDDPSPKPWDVDDPLYPIVDDAEYRTPNHFEARVNVDRARIDYGNFITRRQTGMDKSHTLLLEKVTHNRFKIIAGKSGKQKKWHKATPTYEKEEYPTEYINADQLTDINPRV